MSAIGQAIDLRRAAHGSESLRLESTRKSDSPPRLVGACIESRSPTRDLPSL